MNENYKTLAIYFVFRKDTVHKCKCSTPSSLSAKTYSQEGT